MKTADNTSTGSFFGDIAFVLTFLRVHAPFPLSLSTALLAIIAVLVRGDSMGRRKGEISKIDSEMGEVVLLAIE